MGSRGLSIHSVLIFVELLALMSITVTANTSFDRAFTKFLDENKYSGGAVAAMRDGKLLVAKGYGTDSSGNEVRANSKFRLSSVAKSLTGVAIMQLVQDGKISLQSKVFGDDGILKEIQPWRETSVDSRLYEITVGHLLHHSAGWDISKGPLYDPFLNKLYRKRHPTVPNIALDMGASLPLKSHEIISYVMSYPLSFTPGTSTAYSNVAYLVLGRVVEAVSSMEYKEFVKKSILDPCGMWNTRPASPSAKGSKPATNDIYSSLYDSLDPMTVDSTLGWYSNIYDMMRFIRCTFEAGELLNEKHMALLLGKLDSQHTRHNHSWYCPGFHADTSGNVWQDADMHADDLLLHHSVKAQDGSQKENVPDSWIVFLHGKSINHIRHNTKDLMSELDVTGPSENMFLYDLSDLHVHPKWEPPKSDIIPEYTVKYRVDEHHLVAYVDAIQDEGFNVIWLTSYTLLQHTFFLLVSKQINRPIRSQYDYIFEHGMDHRQLLKRKLQLEEAGYNMTQLHSYKSHAHSNPISFAAIFRYDAFSSDMQMKYGTGHLPEPYEKLVQMYYEKHFYPISQTVVYHNKDEQFSFIFIKEISDERTDFKHYYDLSANKLAKLTAENAKVNLYLSYLNSYDISGKFRLAAIYTNTTDSGGVLEIDQPEDQATETIISNLKKGIVPKYMVPTMGDNWQLKLVTYYEDE